MKQITLFILIILTIGKIVISEEIKTETLSKASRIHVTPMSTIDLPKDASVFWQGWVKFFHYDNSTHYTRPKAFYQNDEYFHQRIKNALVKNKDKSGLLRIPDRASFFLVVYNNTLSFYNTRDKILMFSYDSLNLDFIKMLPEDKLVDGGIKDLGDFDEGKCIEITAKIPTVQLEEFTPFYKGRDQMWVICNTKINDKKKLFKTLIKLKLRRQRQYGQMATKDYLKRQYKKQGESIDNMFKNPNAHSGLKAEKPRDGYWILLNNWTKCTLKCGGGKSFQQWMCVPPKAGGKACNGKGIKSKNCNTQKCPGVTQTLAMLVKKKKDKIFPIVKVLPFSNRPQRYSKCLIKETDAYVMKENDLGKTVAKQPVRVVMNNKTLSIFEDENYQSNMHTFQLKDVSLFRSKEWCCINVKDSYKSFRLCGFEANCGPKAKNIWVDEWDSSFQLFRKQCQSGITLLSVGDLKYLYGDMKDKMKNLEVDIETKKERVLEEKLQKKNVKILGGKIKKMEDIGFKVLDKELNIEMLLKKEEKQREGMEMKKLMKKIGLEKKKKDCMDKKIKERELEDKKLLAERDATAEIKKQKVDLSLDLELKRAELKRQIQFMRRRAKRKRSALEQQLQTIRAKMAGNAMKANKMGLISNCRKGKASQKERGNYCDANFIEDFIKNSECKVEDQFCYICCENEFGNMYLKRRENCYDMCDESGKKKQNKSVQSDTGRWVWAQKIPKKKNIA